MNDSPNCKQTVTSLYSSTTNYYYKPIKNFHLSFIRPNSHQRSPQQIDHLKFQSTKLLSKHPDIIQHIQQEKRTWPKILKALTMKKKKQPSTKFSLHIDREFWMCLIIRNSCPSYIVMIHQPAQHQWISFLFHGLVSLFNGISIFMGYLVPKPLF